jgi:hypothetical protein
MRAAAFEFAKRVHVHYTEVYHQGTSGKKQPE